MDEPRTRAQMIARAEELEADAEAHRRNGRSAPQKRALDAAQTLRLAAVDAEDPDPDATFEVLESGALATMTERVSELEGRVAELEGRPQLSEEIIVLLTEGYSQMGDPPAPEPQPVDEAGDPIPTPVEPLTDTPNEGAAVLEAPADAVPSEGASVADADTAAEADVPEPGYEVMTQEVLAEALKARGLPHSGTKTEQIARLLADDEAIAAEAAEIDQAETDDAETAAIIDAPAPEAEATP